MVNTWKGFMGLLHSKTAFGLNGWRKKRIKDILVMLYRRMGLTQPFCAEFKDHKELIRRCFTEYTLDQNGRKRWTSFTAKFSLRNVWDFTRVNWRHKVIIPCPSACGVMVLTINNLISTSCRPREARWCKLISVGQGRNQVNICSFLNPIHDFIQHLSHKCCLIY